MQIWIKPKACRETLAASACPLRLGFWRKFFWRSEFVLKVLELSNNSADFKLLETGSWKNRTGNWADFIVFSIFQNSVRFQHPHFQKYYCNYVCWILKSACRTAIIVQIVDLCCSKFCGVEAKISGNLWISVFDQAKHRYRPQNTENHYIFTILDFVTFFLFLIE